jgi:RNA-directed DNA polymerase
MRDRAVWVVQHHDPLLDSFVQGTAFFLKDVGLVTAAHCVDGVDSVEVFHPSKHANAFTATVLRRHKYRDLAILQHQISSTEFFELSPASSASASGEPMTALGYPNWGPGDLLNIKPGYVTTVTVKFENVEMIEVNQKLTQGMSGGPVLDASGSVVGIIHKGGPEEERDFAISISMLNKWLSERPL